MSVYRKMYYEQAAEIADLIEETAKLSEELNEITKKLYNIEQKLIETQKRLEEEYCSADASEVEGDDDTAK